MNTATAVAALFNDLGAHTPSLPRARCRENPRLWDAEHPAHTVQAIAECAICAERGPCADWVNNLPKDRLPAGVVAGRRVRSRGVVRPVKPPAPRPPQPPPKPRRITKTDKAAQWLADYLAAGPVISTRLRADAVAAGINLDTLTRARRKLGVQPKRTNIGAGQRLWELPNSNNERITTMMTDDQINEYMPDHEQFRLAKQFVYGWATSDHAILQEAVHCALETGHPVRFFGAFAEIITRAYDLRDKPDHLSDWRDDIWLHFQAQQAEKED